MKITNPRLKKTVAFIKEYRELFYMYIIYAIALTFIFSQTNCTPSKLKYKSLIKNGKVYVTIRVTLYTTPECYYCDVARTFLRTNQIKFIEKNFENPKAQQELFTIADKINFDKRDLDGVPAFVFETKENTTIIVGYSRAELLWILKKKASLKKTFLRKKTFFN
jgi:glutaredoxin